MSDRLDLAYWYRGEIPFLPFAPAECALVIIDMQFGQCHPDGLFGRSVRVQGLPWESYYFERIERLVVPNLVQLLALFRENRLWVIHLVTGTVRADGKDLPGLQRLEDAEGIRRFGIETFARVGTPDYEILAELAPRPDEPVVRKVTAGGFTSTGLDLLLRSLGTNTILFTGQSTNQCVESTARVAADLGYNCVIVDDATATTDQESHDAALKTFGRTFGKIKTTRQVVDEYPWRIWHSGETPEQETNG
jgi:nicotinamidase-related amidase